MTTKFHPPGLAAMNVKNAGKKYQPSNGTEGDYFISMYCMRCTEDGDNCEILGKTFAFKVEDPEYPPEWQYGADGHPTCTAFSILDGEEAEPVAERCKHTVDMFELGGAE